MVGSRRRVVLLLQGPATPFFAVLADAFEDQGARCVRINVSAGDWVRWRGRPATNYRGPFAQWDEFLEQFVSAHGVTDIVYYADRNPYHRVARDVANRLGVAAYVVENGYLRPDWITLERGGMGVYSHFPDDPDLINAIGQQFPKPDMTRRFSHPFPAEAYYEVSYNLAAYFGRPLYPGLVEDRYYHPMREYLAWLPRLAMGLVSRDDTDSRIEALERSGTPFFLFPLQLQSDYQIRDNSPFTHLNEVIELVLGSFARHAPDGTHLVVKIHPFDCGIERFPRKVAEVAKRHGIADRVMCVSGGVLQAMLNRSVGSVMVNSTVGLHAVLLSKPVKVLGIAVFDLPGLTYQGPLDDYWTEASPPDATLRENFLRALAGTTQVKGSFYSAAGMNAAAVTIAERVLNLRVNAFSAFADPPPRLARARALGIEVDAVQPTRALMVMSDR